MSQLDLTHPVDLISPSWSAAAVHLQGNIVKPHGRKHTVMLLFVLAQGDGLRAALRDLAAAFVTSAAGQQNQRDRIESAPNSVFGNLGLSAAGYRKLGIDQEALQQAFALRGYTQNWFLDGMRAKGNAWGDALDQLEAFYQKAAVDGYLLLACAGECPLLEAAAMAKRRLSGCCAVVHEERGQVLEQNGLEYEPFGFRDAISMPSVLTTGAAPPPHNAETLLFRDRLAGQSNCFGTFVVYRKLEQDVTGFGQAAQALGQALGLTADEAAARIVGRRKDGTALVADFSQDPSGRVCPLQAHIRKVNPQVSARGGRIVVPLYRRGVPYRTDQTQGLLFLAMQQNIATQFGLAMRDWVNDSDFPVPGTGTDSLLGRPGGVQDWNGFPHDVGRHVTFRGGEFFFLPSLAFFRSLGG